MTNPTEAAVEAGARAILAGADIGSFYASGDWDAAGADVQMSMYKASADALTAALPILHPATHNTVEALEALPIGSVIRGNDADGPVAERETSDEWAIWDRSCTTPQLVGLGQRHDITEWTVLWPLGGAA